MKLDYRKISENKVSEKLRSLLNLLRSYEDYNFELLGFAVPFFLIFLTTTIISLILNPQVIPAYILTYFIETLVIKFANKVVAICDIRSFKNYYIPTIDNLIRSSKGIQLYNSIDYFSEKFYQKAIEVWKTTKTDLSKAVWKVFFYTTLMFLLFGVVYIIKAECYTENLFNISNVELIYLVSAFFYIMFLVSIFRYFRINDLSDVDISNYTLQNDKTLPDRIPEKDNLFVAFHGVYFQNPTEFADYSILDNVSFSVLPGEIVAFTGENKQGISYIFDLLLKFYVPQSGKIYISGIPIDNISDVQVRNLIGVFEQNFSLLIGTILDNLELLTQNRETIMSVSEKTGLTDMLDAPVLDENGNILVSQTTLLRLQLARIAIQKPKIILIKTPETFESATVEKMFYDFVFSISKRKTVFIETDDLETIIYSNKILYLGENETIFGSHAEISLDKAYQTYIKQNLLARCSSPRRTAMEKL